ncbi:MAG: membrane dipeptidase [Chitinophagaceae bacterium]|nr:MAG: membrane dipeptidase [Chitinophagaceae bacterium]
MRKLSLLICILISLPAFTQSYQKLHRKAIFIDTHNDILTQNAEKGVVFDTDLKGKTHSDLDRWNKGGLDAQLFSVWCDGDKKDPYSYANRQLDTLDAVIRRNPGKIVKASDSRDLIKIIRQHKIAAMAGVEGGHMIENDINKLDSFYQRGVRYMTLTWNNSTDWATSAFEETFKKDLTKKGLSDFGKQVVERMNTLGMIVDISHVGENTFDDVIRITSKPIIASHSSVYTLCPHQRNLKDDQIRAIAKNGGVIQINFYSGFLDSNFLNNKSAFLAKHKSEWDSIIKSGKPEYIADEFIVEKYPDEAEALRAPFSLLIQHIDYIIKLVGINYVGIGSDFDGIEAPPKQLDDVTAYPLVTKALMEKGYKKRDIRKILGGNFMRVLRANEKKQYRSGL